jgi:hypothetical protein
MQWASPLSLLTSLVVVLNLKTPLPLLQILCGSVRDSRRSARKSKVMVKVVASKVVVVKKAVTGMKPPAMS